MNDIKDNVLAYIQTYQQNPLSVITFAVDIAIVIFVAYHIFKIFAINTNKLRFSTI